MPYGYLSLNENPERNGTVYINPYEWIDDHSPISVYNPAFEISHVL